MILPLSFNDIVIAYAFTPLIGVCFMILIKLFAHFIKI